MWYRILIIMGAAGGAGVTLTLPWPWNLTTLVPMAALGVAIGVMGIAPMINHLMRRQRHRFHNHMQVVSGWLELDRPDRARDYLDQLMRQSQAMSVWTRTAPAWAQAAAWYLDSMAEASGIVLVWGEVEAGGTWWWMRLSWALFTVLRWMRHTACSGPVSIWGSPDAFHLTVKGGVQETHFRKVGGLISTVDLDGATFHWRSGSEGSGAAG